MRETKKKMIARHKYYNMIAEDINISVVNEMRRMVTELRMMSIILVSI